MADANDPNNPNNAALMDARRRVGSGGQLLDSIIQGSNFDRDEVDRLRKRFMKRKQTLPAPTACLLTRKDYERLELENGVGSLRIQDNSGTIERDEFLSLPQVSSNPLATRMIAIFDEDGGGDVDFQEFVSGLSAFSSKGNKEEKLRFAFKVYDIDRDGYISNGELFIVLKMMVGSNLKDMQLQQIVDKTIMEADTDRDGKISFEEFTKMVENTDISMSMTLGTRIPPFSQANEVVQPQTEAKLHGHHLQVLAKRYLTIPQINSKVVDTLNDQRSVFEAHLCRQSKRKNRVTTERHSIMKPNIKKTRLKGGFVMKQAGPVSGGHLSKSQAHIIITY
ncbi:hypothetical protein JMJ35_004732 [Cladonia borealis]|uniref:Calcineurin subunit B n=1 Tax=Cladonia borealis TaxID=184061 RepID=A0AA39V8H1_9LECA|nr:hypothetical protein JMJ35_004732 [Cladonia borealis]